MEKGKAGRRRRRLNFLPVREPANPSDPVTQVWRAVHAWTAAKRRLCPHLASESAQIWRLPCDGSAALTADTQSAWLRAAMALCDIEAPPGFKYTSHSLRQGGIGQAHRRRS